ncbi:MAG: nucleotidyltransferase domain-containing protein [Gammaproteobacteria bacterium]|nr:nucleotidyltransferase domain-containing protein [Gammaproteobacteria bacterium]
MNGLPAYQFLERLQALPFVEAIWLYGSRARGDHRPRSDIDLAIVCPAASDRQWQEVLDIVENADTLLEIDCLRLDREAPGSALRQNVEKDKRVIYQRKTSL